MNSKYLLNIKHVEGSVEFSFNEMGLLVEYICNAEFAEAQLVFLLKKIPRDTEEIEKLEGLHPSFKVTKLTHDLSFEAFWSAYGQKIHPHRCEPLWNKLKDSDKLAALQALPAYFKYLSKTGVAKANPQNFIIRQYWRTDWRAAA